jgi:PAS domain S-box-containing protein
MDNATGRRPPGPEPAYPSLLLDQLGVAVIATDTDLRVTAWNRAAEELYGWPGEQVIGRPVAEVIGPLFRAGARDAILAQLDRGESVEVDRDRSALGPVIQHHRSGRMLIIEGHAAPLHSADGMLIGYVAAVHDATHQARLSGELAESEEKYRNLVELSPDAILVHQDGTIVFANPAAAALVGADAPGDLIGRPVLELVHPDSRKDVEWNISADLRGEESPITTVEVLRRDGTTVPAQGRGARIPVAGRPAVQVILRDITRVRQMEETLRESEEKYRSLVDLSPDPIIVHRGETVLHANAAAARLAGLASPGALVGTDLLAYVHPGDRAAVRERIETVQRERVTVPIRPFRLTVDNTVRAAEAVGGPAWWDGAPAVQVIITETPVRRPAREASS